MTFRVIALAALALHLVACRASEQTSAMPGSQEPALAGRVVDEAQLLTPDQEFRLAGELAELERRTTDQLVIVTVPTLRGRMIEDYSRDYGNRQGIGQADMDNGVLLVVAPKEGSTRIHVGFGLESILTNERTQAIVDRDLLPNFREGRWHEGISAGTSSIVSTLIAHEREPRRGRE